MIMNEERGDRCLPLASSTPDGNGFRISFRNSNTTGDLFWCPSQLLLPPPNYTPGLITILKNSLDESYASGSTSRAVLCYQGSVHVNRERWDARWGCGYRNFLMACIALMDQNFQPMYHPLLNNPIPPGIRNLQAWIEEAWKVGFDTEGAKGLGKLLGTSKWIGTADLWVAFSSRGIPAELVDFNLKDEPRGVEIVTEWIINYFSQEPALKTPVNSHDTPYSHPSPIAHTNHMPIILQHEGHSRTIVGYEVSKNGAVKLLMFDPSYIPSKSFRKAALSSFYATHPTYQSASTSANPQPTHIYCVAEEDRDCHSRTPNSPPISGNGRGRAWRTLLSIERHIIDGSKEPRLAHKKAHQILVPFSLESKKLRRKQYQILYFPMTPPLTHNEMMQKKVVTSTKIC